MPVHRAGHPTLQPGAGAGAGAGAGNVIQQFGQKVMYNCMK